MYRKLLLRNPDQGALNYWVAETAARGRGSVALRFFQSRESGNTRVNNLYLELLDRPADPGGIASWSDRILVEGDIVLAANLAASNEYFNRAQARFPKPPSGNPLSRPTPGPAQPRPAAATPLAPRRKLSQGLGTLASTPDGTCDRHPGGAIMAVDESNRLHLLETARDGWGEEAAHTLMDLLLPDHDQLATKSDVLTLRGEFAQLRTEVKGEIAQLRTELVTQGRELRAEMESMEHRLSARDDRLESALTARMNDQTRLMMLSMLGIWVTLVLGLLGLHLS